jgi:hypothetical protein
MSYVMPLADTQRAFARAVMSGDASDPALPAFVGRIAPSAAFSVHRGTVLGGLTNALRLTYPTIDNLVGADFFDHAATAFIATEPPAMANLSAYGDGYPAFLRGFAPAAGLPYLAAVASLDLAIDRVQRAERRPPRRLVIEAQVAVEVPEDLRLLDLAYPAAAVRALIDADDVGGLSGLDMAPGRYIVAVWRGGQGAMVKRIAPPAGRFLQALVDAQPVEEAFAAAVDGEDAQLAVAAIQADVFAAPFATIIPLSEPVAP